MPSIGNLHINYQERDVEDVQVTKFLGITPDNKLTWKLQGEQLCWKLSKSPVNPHMHSILCRTK